MCILIKYNFNDFNRNIYIFLIIGTNIDTIIGEGVISKNFHFLRKQLTLIIIILLL